MSGKHESSEAEIRVYVPMTPAVHARISELAERLDIGAGRMAAILLEDGLQDNEWVYRVVSARFMKPIRALVDRWEGRGKGRAGKASEG